MNLALGWTLFHSLWEGLALALLLAVVLASTRSARVRYWAACGTMLALLAAFGITFARLAPQSTGSTILARPVAVPQAAAASVAVPSTWHLSDAVPWLAPLWLAGVLLFQLRFLVSWNAAARMKRVGVCAAPFVWTQTLDRLRLRLRMARPVMLLESCLTDVPVVIGHLRPAILVPLGLLAGLPSEQMEAILLHELAHIRRADYLVNLFQTIVEGLFFYHPAVWWISRVIRAEREKCCDDIVVKSCDAHQYATALATLAELRFEMRQAAMAATGGNLEKRIRRLLLPQDRPRATPMLSAAIVAIAFGAAVFAWPSPPPPQEPKASAYNVWLKQEVVYIISNAERKNFLSLTTDRERDAFIQNFWASRDPVGHNPDNEFKHEIYRRIAYANDRFSEKIPGWKTDRGRIYIQYGPPDEIESHPTGQGGAKPYPFEQWLYRYLQGLGQNVIVEFADKSGTGEFHLVADPLQNF